ncbi:hypothetical protein ACNPON_14780, partial [Glutamicibacter sp. AGC13]
LVLGLPVGSGPGGYRLLVQLRPPGMPWANSMEKPQGKYWRGEPHEVDSTGLPPRAAAGEVQIEVARLLPGIAQEQ